jgi:hypothetical protein
MRNEAIPKYVELYKKLPQENSPDRDMIFHQMNMEKIDEENALQRRLRRRTAASNRSSLDIYDPKDGETYLIYPPEPEATVNFALYYFLLCFNANKRSSIHYHRMP